MRWKRPTKVYEVFPDGTVRPCGLRDLPADVRRWGWNTALWNAICVLRVRFGIDQVDDVGEALIKARNQGPGYLSVLAMEG